jgi:hypothetical protein
MGNSIAKPADLNTLYNQSFPGQFFQFLGIFRSAAQMREMAEHDQDVMQMNEVPLVASEWVQGGPTKVAT